MLKVVVVIVASISLCGLGVTSFSLWNISNSLSEVQKDSRFVIETAKEFKALLDAQRTR